MLKFKDKMGEEIILRPWTDNDIDDLIEITNHKWLVDNLKSNYNCPMTRQEAKEFIDCRKNIDQKTTAFAIELEGKVIGNITIFKQENIFRRSAELTFWLSNEYWNRGIMTGSVKKVVPFAFENMPVDRIYAEPYSRNIGSKILLKRCGFRFDGNIRSCVLKGGIISDVSVFSIISTEIQSLKTLWESKGEEEYASLDR